MTPTAVVLAGSRDGIDPVAHDEGVSAKALVTIAEETMLSRVVHALRGAGISRVLVSANDPAVIAEAERLGAEPVAAAGGPSASVSAAFDLAGAPLLVTTADHPLLQREWIAQFTAAVPAGADVAVLLARSETVHAALPDTRRTWLRFRDGAFSGCNLFLLATPRAAGALHLWAEVEANRKRPWRLVRRLGIMVLARYLIGHLALGDALTRLGRLAGVEAAMVETRFGLAAVDVDTPADLANVRALIAAGVAPPRP